LTRFIGLTGGIGAGKSEALAAFGRLGAETLSTDGLTRDLLGEDEVRDRLVERWGEAVAPGGVVDRDRVAEIVFARPEELGWLEGLLHPMVGERVLSWRRQLDDPVEVAVVEVPLLFESGMEDAFDSTVAVIAEDEVRKRRLGERALSGLEGRSSRQLSQAEKAARADHVIRNDGTLAELERSVQAVFSTERERGGSG
jgi:dephospho-CoA kinase